VTGTRRKTDEAPREDAPDVLNTSPFEGDLEEKLAAEPPPRRKLPSATVFLGAGVLLVAGFVGGIQADRQWGAKKTPDAASIINQLQNLRGGQAGGGGGFGGGFRQSQGGGARTGGTQTTGNDTTGTIKLVDGDIIYVQTSDGIVRVKTSDATKVTIAQKSTLKKLKTGAKVTVQGTASQDGTVTATSVAQGG
jgi:hypothetical protein